MSPVSNYRFKQTQHVTQPQTITTPYASHGLIGWCMAARGGGLQVQTIRYTAEIQSLQNVTNSHGEAKHCHPQTVAKQLGTRHAQGEGATSSNNSLHSPKKYSRYKMLHKQLRSHKLKVVVAAAQIIHSRCLVWSGDLPSGSLHPSQLFSRSNLLESQRNTLNALEKLVHNRKNQLQKCSIAIQNMRQLLIVLCLHI